jgi:uncharacterized protein (UPF0332 family)
MTADEARERLTAYWLEQADEALASARSEQQAGRRRFAVNRCYYACFYAASAILLKEGQTFVRHAGVRDAVFKFLVHAGRIDTRFGTIYGDLFAARHKVDYESLVEVDNAKAAAALQQATEFVTEMRRLAAQ